jgi:acyl-CoA synthetase (AMP-forming)/AMP-acid ligase II
MQTGPFFGPPLQGTTSKTTYGNSFSHGVLLSGMEARIVRDDGSGAAVNEPGELWLKGGSTALGYLNNEMMTRKTFVNGWMRTGDYFRVDQNGIFSQVYCSSPVYYPPISSSY